MKLFGGWLPFIGVVALPTDNTGEPTGIPGAHWEADFFGVEWFGEGLALFRVSGYRRVRG